MLLPSAISCDIISVPVQPRRPMLPSFAPYQPRTTTIPQSAPTVNPITDANNVYSTSCSLQSILGTTLPPSPIARSLWKPFDQPTRTGAYDHTTPAEPLASVRGMKKRRRVEFEVDNDDDNDPDTGCDSIEGTPSQESYSTPKRRRNIPLSIPLGLSANDFTSLGNPAPITIIHTTRRVSDQSCTSGRDDDSGYGQSPVEDDLSWTNEDDRILLETVLEKLRLSKNDWNDCARVLGRDKDSLGRRWKLLVGDGDVGLRRRGRTRRPGLDIQSW